MTREILQQAATILHKHHTFQTRYSRAKRAANATCADFRTSPIAELAEAAYMEVIGKETESLLDAIRAYLAKPQGEPETWIAGAVDRAMAEMENISPPLRRSECKRLIYAALEARPDPETCEWTQSDEWWSTACGASWVFIDCGPAENGVKFCHACGKPVEIAGAP